MNTQLDSTDSVELEIAREELRKEIAKADALEWLMGTDQFKLVILDGFIKGVVNGEAKQLISPNEIVSAIALDKIKAAKYLEAFMQYVTDCGMAAKMDLAKGID